MATIFLDISNFQGLLTGTWEDTTTTGGYGKWTVDGTDFQGLYRPSNGGYSIDTYRDVNKNGIIDSNDILVGVATLASAPTSGIGTWNWSVTGGTGDYYSSDGLDVGNVVINNLNFLKTGIKLNAVLGILFSSEPKEGSGIFKTSIYLSAGNASTSNLAEGAKVWWKVSCITADDLASGDLSGW
jgi:hypothetical protein